MPTAASDAGAAVEDGVAGPVGDRHGDQREDQRQRAGGGLALADERHPAVQQQVVQRRRAVHDQRRRDVEEVVRGDPDRDPLVDPVAGLQARHAQRQRPGHEEAEHREQRQGESVTRARTPDQHATDDGALTPAANGS